MFTKRVCAGVLAGVVASSAVCFPFISFSVVAVDSSIQSFYDEYSRLLNEITLDTTLNVRDLAIAYGGQLQYLMMLENAAESYSVTSWTSYNGFYRIADNQIYYPVSACPASGKNPTLYVGAHFNIKVLNDNTDAFYSGYASTSGSSYVVGTSSDFNYRGQTVYDNSGFFTSSYQPYTYYVERQISFGEPPILISGSDVAGYSYIGGFNYTYDMPSGEFDIVKPWLYYNDVLLPDLRSKLPDAPDDVFVYPYGYDTPIEPIYPTDFVTGVPKDWTITNPQLPEIPDLDFQIPTADFDSLDVSPIRQNLSGVGFWWDLLETVLDTTAFKGLFLAFAIIGLAIFVLWKLGA